MFYERGVITVDIRAYVLAVTAAAIFCGLVNILMGEKGSAAAIVKLLSGIVLTSVVIQPLGELVISDLDFFLQNVEADAYEAVSAGSDTARDALAERIRDRTEAYILDKAAELDLALTIEVILSQGDLPVPSGVILTGPASPYAKNTMQTWISDELGIPREEQTWM